MSKSTAQQKVACLNGWLLQLERERQKRGIKTVSRKTRTFTERINESGHSMDSAGAAIRNFGKQLRHYANR